MLYWYKSTNTDAEGAPQEDPSAKAIVFSQFVSMLDLIEHRLKLAGVETVKLDGRMSFEARDIIHTRTHTHTHLWTHVLRGAR